MDEKAVADGVERIHQEYSSVIQYNDENSLSSVLTIAYLSSMQYYFKPIRELPAGRGFADFVYLPKPEYRTSYPALLVELKWNKSTDTAMEQIRDKNIRILFWNTQEIFFLWGSTIIKRRKNMNAGLKR